MKRGNAALKKSLLLSFCPKYSIYIPVVFRIIYIHILNIYSIFFSSNMSTVSKISIYRPFPYILFSITKCIVMYIRSEKNHQPPL